MVLFHDIEQQFLSGTLSNTLRLLNMISNLLADCPRHLSAELSEILVKTDAVRIERIVSAGHVSPDGFWYDQQENEWVAVLSGEARLRFDDDPHPLHLKPGDWITIPAGRKHRVEWTTPEEPTVWLAVFFSSDE